jgi:hypothetical protein
MTIAPVTGMTPGSLFDQLKKSDEFGEWWSARELMPVYGYSQWRSFMDAVNRAKVACATSAQHVTSNFADTRKINSSRHKVPDVRLTRYAAYLVAMEGDPSKPEIAGAKTYFAVQTRKAELDDGLAPRYQAMMQNIRELARLEAAQQAQQQMIDVHSAEIASSRKDIETHREEFRRVIEEVKGVARQLETVEDRVIDVETITPLTDPRALHSGKEAAQLCGMGHITFFDRLRTLGVLYRDQQKGGHKMYQRYLDQNWGTARLMEFKRGDRTDWAYTPYFTAKGITGIQRLLAEGQLPL